MILTINIRYILSNGVRDDSLFTAILNISIFSLAYKVCQQIVPLETVH